MIRNALVRGDLGVVAQAAEEIPIRKLINPLFSFFCALDELMKWRAVSMMGILVPTLADKEMESARVIMRRLMWSLNDESGGIGWGAPEAMGEIMAHHAGLAGEYSHILVSYIQEDKNYLEHPMLERGVIWGIGRLAENRPEHATDAMRPLLKFFHSLDPVHRGFAAWAAGNMRIRAATRFLENLLDDHSEILFYEALQLLPMSISQIALAALAKIS